MARILAIDYGGKRTGLAVTDTLQIIAAPLTTIETKQLVPFLFDYFKKEEVEKVIIGYPLNIDGSATNITERIDKFIVRFKRLFPNLEIIQVDEAYSSKSAVEAMIQSGMKKKDRRVKSNVDKIAAAIILQEYMAGNNLLG